ncbi:Pentatricopeptide repeat [Dillenia turbinata]|uniref:Pentatricopeptide repeat n=1 Tax=Dillenia turbinata TaxID=194707 RepID=A0AAN8UNS2_9MAGN
MTKCNNFGAYENGRVEEAIWYFERNPFQNLISWTAATSGLVQNGPRADGWKVFDSILEKNGMAWNSMVGRCCQNGKMEEALVLFQQIPDRNDVSWNTIIAVLIGGPYYSLLTGSYQPHSRPTDNVTQFLWTFAPGGFNARHNIGRMGCGVIRAKFNFTGAGSPDPCIPADLLNKMRRRCPDQDHNLLLLHRLLIPVLCLQRAINSMPNGEKFDAYFYKNLLEGRGLIFSDQPLTASVIMSRIV